MAVYSGNRLQAFFDKVYHDRVVKQSAKRRPKLTKEKLRQLLKQQHSHASRKYLTPSEKDLRATRTSSSDGIIMNEVDDHFDRKLCKLKHKKFAIPLMKEEVQSVINDSGKTDSVSKTIAKSLKLAKDTGEITNHTRKYGSFKCGNEEKTNHTKGKESAMGKHIRLDEQCEGETNIWIRQHCNSHAAQNKVPHKARVLLAEEPPPESTKEHKPYSSLFSTSHAGPIRKSIVDEL